jgi:YesN/AraC family two-component response regulator
MLCVDDETQVLEGLSQLLEAHETNYGWLMVEIAIVVVSGRR